MYLIEAVLSMKNTYRIVVRLAILFQERGLNGMKKVIRFVQITSSVCSLIAGLCGVINQCIEFVNALKNTAE